MQVEEKVKRLMYLGGKFSHSFFYKFYFQQYSLFFSFYFGFYLLEGQKTGLCHDCISVSNLRFSKPTFILRLSE